MGLFSFFKFNTVKREVIINCEKLETRVAIIENGKLEEFHIEHPSQSRIVGNIYKGIVQNLENELNAAFVDIGLKKNAFIHYWDMNPLAADLLEEIAEDAQELRAETKPQKMTAEEVSKKFPPGSEIVIQITKGAVGTKGPRATTSITLPGKYLVFVAGTDLIGVSRKIQSKDVRNDLRKLLSKLPRPDGIGIIARTAAQDASKKNIIREFRSLLEKWNELQIKIREVKAPACVYQEPDIIERTIRDWLTEDINKVIIDSPEEYERAVEIAGKISRRLKSKIHLYKSDIPIFDYYDIESQLEDAYKRKVLLPSGAYLVFDETEAMVTIDVNTGRFKGKDSIEEAILEVNLEAVEEIARQLRLRNIGGIIVIDFIDMRSKRNRYQVFKAMKNALMRDRAKTNVLPISDLGLMEMTRQRSEDSISSTTLTRCPYCDGRGSILSPLGISANLQRRIIALARKIKNDKGTVPNMIITVHPTVLERLKTYDEEILLEIQKNLGIKLIFKSDPLIHIEEFTIADEAKNTVLYTNAKSKK